MRILSEQIFDQNLSGASTFWYTSSEWDQVLGNCDRLGFQIVTTGASGTSPLLTVSIQYSADGQNWVIWSTDISGQAVINNAQYYLGVNSITAAYVRLQISLGGTSPATRLKAYVCGRSN